jgi:hypothetical protein
MPNWRNWSSFRLSITAGFVSWLALSYAWAKSTPNGAIDRTVGALFSAVMGAGYRVFEIVFPNWARPHSGLVYLATLFASLCNFLVLTAAWYICVRTARALRPEWAFVPAAPTADSKEDDFELCDSDHEPEYVPSKSVHAGDNVTPTVDYEKFKWRNWKLFRKHRGRWPIFSIVFHYFSLVGMLANAIAFFKIRDQNDWSTPKSWLVGGIIAISWCGFFVGGQKLMWRLDWRRSGQHEHRLEPEGRHLF